MSEQYKPQPDGDPSKGIDVSMYMEQHPDAIEDVELAELAAHMTKEDEERIRFWGQQALIGMVEGDDQHVKRSKDKRIEIRLNADEKVANLTELYDTIKSDPSAERVAGSPERGESLRGLFEHEGLYSKAVFVLDETSERITERAAAIQREENERRKETGEEAIGISKAAIDFSFDSQLEGDERDELIIEKLTSTVAKIAEIDYPEEGLDSISLMHAMREAPDKVDNRGVARLIAGRITAELVNRAAANGDFTDLEGAARYYAEKGIKLRDVHKATKRVGQGIESERQAQES